MKNENLNNESPELKEAKRIAEMKKLSYEDRLHRMLVMMDISYVLKNAPRIEN